MRKLLIPCLLSLLLFSSVIAQDRIAKKDGAVLSCEIISIDSLIIKLNYNNGKGIVETYIEKKDVLYYEDNGEIVLIHKDNLNMLTQLFNYADSIENLNKFFLYSYKGDIIFGKEIEYTSLILGPTLFLVDSKEILSENVKFFKNDSGFYANTKSFNFLSTTHYTKRIKRGKINLYETETIDFNNNYSNPSSGSVSGGMPIIRIDNYYNTGFSDLKKLNYENLRVDLISNLESMKYLNKYESQKNIQTILNIVGAGVIVLGSATLINKMAVWDGRENLPKPRINGNISTILLGTGIIFTSYFMSLSNKTKLKKAVDAYNQ